MQQQHSGAAPLRHWLGAACATHAHSRSPACACVPTHAVRRGYTLAVVVLASAAKFLPSMLMGKLCTKRDWRFCITLGVLSADTRRTCLAPSRSAVRSAALVVITHA